MASLMASAIRGANRHQPRARFAVCRWARRLHSARHARHQAFALGARSAMGPAYTRGDDARRVGSAFVQQLSMAHHDEAYRLMAAAYRQTTPFSAFQSACIGSPFLSTARSVTLSKTSETVAPGQDKGALNATGVMTTGAGAVEVKFSFLDDASGPGHRQRDCRRNARVSHGRAGCSREERAGQAGQEAVMVYQRA